MDALTAPELFAFMVRWQPRGVLAKTDHGTQYAMLVPRLHEKQLPTLSLVVFSEKP